MGVTSVEVHGETCYNSLIDYVQRGNLYGAYSNDGSMVIVYYDSPLGYPIGETLVHVPVQHIPQLIAVLTAVLNTK